MSTAELDASAPSEALEPVATSPDDSLLPAWPVLCLLWGMPLWWLVGLFNFNCVLLAPVMLFYLVLKRDVWLAPGTLPFLSLVGWMALGIFVIEPGDLFGFVVKFAQYAAVGVLIVYVVNAPTLLTRDRILAGLTALWAFIIAGGYLGLALPYGHLTKTVGILLPSSISSNPYAQQLLFPQFAEVQTPFGASAPFLRPSAPFYFANGWGAAMTLLIPVAVGAALHRGTTRAKILTVAGLGLCLPPAVAANNRGMFLALAVAVAVLFVRSFAQARFGMVLVIGVATAGAAYMMIRLGVVQSLTERADAGQSTAGRTQLYIETIQRTLKSPILGYGAPRDSYSSEITVGTQGAVWAAMFCSGFVGLALLLYFLVGVVIRTWPLTSESDVWLNAGLIATLAMSAYYGLEGMLVPLGILVAMMLRDRYLDPSRSARAG